jgi:CRP-like cAMP-binding protein
MTMNALYLFCTAEHSVEKRVARLLLTLSDELGNGELPVTHELVAAIGNIRRPSVSAAISALSRAGMVRCGHGSTTLIDPVGLALIACPCYAASRSLLAELATPAS